MKITEKQRTISFIINIILLLATWVGMVCSIGSYMFWVYALSFILILIIDCAIGLLRGITNDTEMQEKRDSLISQVDNLLEHGTLYKVNPYEAQTILNILKRYGK